MTDRLERVGAAIFRNLGVEGIYARTSLYEQVIVRLGEYIGGARDPKAEILHFPPLMSRQQLEKSGYLKSFPNLLGCVCALHGSESEIRNAAQSHLDGGDWTNSLTASDLVLSPAACYPLYPLVAARGPVAEEGLIFDVDATCFRHEPSKALSRLQSFRMREFVRIGTPAQIALFRETWMDRAREFASRLGLPCTLEIANDPFFGRIGQVMAVAQRQDALKFELLIAYDPGATPTACMSFNSHKEHFGEAWGITTATGDVAHTSCVAFGMDRLAVALFCIHGVDIAKWPADVRSALGF